MNTKVLASLGVIVALLTAWLFVSLYTASTVSVESAPASISEPQARSSRSAPQGNVSNGVVKTSVTIAEQQVKTSVNIVE